LFDNTGCIPTHSIDKPVLGFAGFGSDDGGLHCLVVDELSIRLEVGRWSGACASLEIEHLVLSVLFFVHDQPSAVRIPAFIK